jgi:hypothetical protein
LGLTGKARFDFVMSRALPDEDSQDKFVLTLVEDPNDVEYTRLLRQAKAEARHRQELAMRPQGDSQPVVGSQAQAKRAAKEIDAKADRPLHGYYEKEPVIKGMPVSAEGIFAEAAEAEAAAAGKKVEQSSPWLAQFAKSKAIQISRPYAEALAKTHDYVFAGTTKDRFGFVRPTWMFKDDAKASITAMPQAKIKAYQKKLDLPQSGLVDPDLQNLWDYAVAMAQNYNLAGQRVDLEYIFETLVNAQAAANAAKGRGGGGGAGAEPLTDVDYYFAMMQVLGDISGVENG